MNNRNSQVVDQEVIFSNNEDLVSTTDKRGVITYANEAFCQVAGFSLEELVGQNHSVVRHPDMPKAAFKDLWDHLKNEQPWRGAVKNKCKDGRYYWVDAYVTPIYQDGTLTGYQSVRTQLKPEYKENANKIYTKLNNGGSLTSKFNSPFFKHIR